LVPKDFPHLAGKAIEIRIPDFLPESERKALEAVEQDLLEISLGFGSALDQRSDGYVAM